MNGNQGADTLNGGEGNDIVRGGKGDDVVMGGAGNDFVSGDRGADTISGGSGAEGACMEDEPCWDCATMGNRVCGHPSAMVTAEDGSRVPRSFYRDTP